jgi:hypothetical protein
LSDTHYRKALNAIPIPAFVVNDDVEILDLNNAAARFCGQNLKAVYGRRGGDVLHCLHSTDAPEGCGMGPHCNRCVIRNSVRKCLETQAVSRKVMNLHLALELTTRELQVLITTSPISDGGEKLAMVMVEDIAGRQKPLYNISPTTPLGCSSAPRQQKIDWHPRPRKLRSFPADTREQLRRLDFNRTITVCVGDKALYVKRIGLDQFLCCDS